MTTLFAFVAQDSRADPVGSFENPIIINNLRDLDQMRNDLGAHYRLGNDIDASASKMWSEGAGWRPVGNETDPFTGTLEGNGHEIIGLFIDRGTEDRVGLFGTTSNAQVKDVALIDLNVTGSNSVGGLVGWNEGLISNSHVSGDISGSNRVGGLAGDNRPDAVVSGSSTIVNVSGNLNVGGLVGSNHGGKVMQSDSSGHVLGNWYVGGLIGSNSGSSEVLRSHSSVDVDGFNCVGGLTGNNLGSTIRDSFAVGDVSGNNIIGGLVGENSGGTIERAYAAGPVVATDSTVGGLIGEIISGTVAQSYWDVESTGQAESSIGGIATADGMTTAEMKQQATFVGWDFGQVWEIEEGVTYPQLSVTAYLTSISVEQGPLQTIYDYGEGLDLTGLVVNLTFSNGSFQLVAFEDFGADITTSPMNGTALSHDNETITVTHVPSGESDTFTINVNAILVELRIETEPVKTDYEFNKCLDISGLEMGLVWSDSSVVVIGLQDFEAHGLSVCTPNGTALDENHDGLVLNVSHADGYYAHLSALTIHMVTVKGMVVDHGGTPMADAEVHVMDDEGNEVLVVTTDENGEFEFIHAPGTFTLQPHKQGHDFPTQTIEAASGIMDIELASLPSEDDNLWIGLAAILLLAILAALGYRRLKDGGD